MGMTMVVVEEVEATMAEDQVSNTVEAAVVRVTLFTTLWTRDIMLVTATR